MNFLCGENFLTDWWDAISKFFKGLSSTVVGLIIAILALLCLLCFVRFLKPMYSADKSKFRPLPLIMCIVFGALVAFVSCAAFA